MPNRPLNNNDNFNSISEWINENHNLNAFSPGLNDINQIPHEKGIYFWLMNPAGYKVLSMHVPIQPINNRFEKEVDNNTYHLLYLGTAGIEGEGNGNLFGRINWHLNQHHYPNNINSDFISTLRSGVGSLLSDDLILKDTEHVVNILLRDFFKVFWIEYPEPEVNRIKEEERILIKKLKPLLNLRNNPNARNNAPPNPTQVYKARRQLVITNTKNRLQNE